MKAAKECGLCANLYQFIRVRVISVELGDWTGDFNSTLPNLLSIHGRASTAAAAAVYDDNNNDHVPSL